MFEAVKVLVTGFGSFPGVPENPTARLARAVDGARIGEATVIGRVLPVSYARGPALAIELAREHGVALVVGTGVAVTRPGVTVETVGRRVLEGACDVDGASLCGLSDDELVAATLDVRRLAAALGATLSDDAGRYVCNAWLHRVASELAVPVGFVHVPAEGIDAERLLDGISALICSTG
jgi:pyroglutamyl-peptidase